MLRRIARAVRREDGFGLIELTIAMTMLAIGISALGGMFIAGHLALRRASQSDTAAVLADKLLERFRAETYDTVGLSKTLFDATDSTYKGDSAYSTATAITDSSGLCSGATPTYTSCYPSRAIPDTSQTPAEVAPDNRKYRLDTYVNWGCSQGNETLDTSVSPPVCKIGTVEQPYAQVKIVTIVVRDNTSAATLAGAAVYRASTTFDRLAGGSMPTVTVTPSTTSTTTTGATTTTSTTPSSPPSAPSSLTFANGAGAGAAYVNTGNAGSLSFDALMPSSSVATDQVDLTLSDGDPNHDQTFHLFATAGAGTVHFTGIPGQLFNDGTITVTVDASNTNGASASLTTTITKDTTAPDAPTGISLANGSGPGNAYINASNKSAVSISAGLDANSAATDTVSVALSNGGSSTSAATTPATLGAGTVTLTGINTTSLADGTITASATVTDTAGNTSAAATVSIPKDATAPTVTITRAGSSPTNASSATWTITFSESVGAVTSGNFSLVNTGLGGTPSITSFSGSGTSYTATASAGTGSGTLGLNLSSGSGIQDGAGNSVSNTTGPTYTIDRTPPTATIARAGSSPTNTAGSLSWTVTFSESVTGVATSNFALANSGLGGAPAISGVSGSGTSWTVTASSGSGSGTLGLNLTSAGSIQDAAGNAVTTPVTGAVYTVDRTAPVLTITLPASGASGYNAGGPFTGTTTDTTTITVKFCKAATWTCGSTPSQTATVSPSAGSYSLTLSGSAKLSNNTSYTMRVEQTDAAGNTGVSADRSFHT
jgi:Tfp pilus assembly protein PilV